jgi:TPR repeat protein
MIEILKEESRKNNVDSLNTLAFLYQHGICVNQSEGLSLQYYKKAATLGSVKAQFMHYYIVSEQNTSRFDFLVKSLIEGYPRALNSFGFLIASGEFNHMSHNYAVAY